MALTIIPPAGAIPVNTLRILYYGQPGTGKSSIGYTHRNPIVLDFDRGAHRSEFSSLGTKVRIDTWSDLDTLARETNNFDGYDTIVIDTISKCIDYLIADIIQKNPKSGNGRGSLSMSGWGELASAFKNWLMRLTTQGKDVVMIAQHVEEKEGDNTRKRPKAQGKQALALILEEADFVGYVHMNEGKRSIGFAPTDDYFGKDSARFGVTVMPDFHTVQTYGEDLIVKMKSALTRITAEKADIIGKVAEWRDTIDGFTTPDEFNAFLPAMQAMQDGPVKLQVQSLIKARRTALGIVWNNEARRFEIAPQEPTPAPQATAPAPQVATPPPASAPVEAPAPAPAPEPAAAAVAAPEPAQTVAAPAVAQPEMNF